MFAATEEALEKALESRGVVFLMGAIDTGKSTFAAELVRRGAEAGLTCAIVDADIGQSTVGPPTTVSLKMVRTTEDLASIAVADELGFVGSLTPRGHLLPLVISTERLVRRAREQGAEVVAVDTTGFVSGVYAQLLKYHKMVAVRPDVVVAFERGGELEPLVGIAQRFSGAEIVEFEVSDELIPRTAEERVAHREGRFAAYFESGASRWRVKPTVFMPTLPPEFDLLRLDGLVVGMEDGRGTCVGIGVLEYDPDEDVLRMVSPVTEGVKGLRLGAVRIDTSGRSRGPVSLRDLFGTE